ncbi:L-proline trans-4-hydroxylase-like isoform X1 [Ostrea edulis]|uniref:L-proline trans-4-hydroxylase-like isoform X1 n=2 Tax=Ostrea edulis TaxID=37623 RepID=UPI0024AE8A00|nr:L-proline trans-4-hydroxylase-like isoform X1 [Ostrea edulis]
MSGNNFEITEENLKEFDDNGFIIVKGFFDAEEIRKLKKCFEDTEEVVNNKMKVDDSLGKEVNLTVWSHPGNDVTGMAARSEKVTNAVEKLLGGSEIYHYHGKLVQKNAKSGGTFLWHQDYGYWYNNGCLFPDMMTVFLALDKCEKANGCLKVLKGSHKCGRIQHSMVADQMAADIDRVGELKKKLDLVYVELDPGDALIFHCNLLHCSGANESDRRRWAYLMCYNTRNNNPVKVHHHPCYTPLLKVPNSAITECENYTDFTGKKFMDKRELST